MSPGSAATFGGRQPVPAIASSRAALVNRDTDNAVSLDDAIQDVSAAAQLPEDGIPAVEVRLWGVRHEELASPRVRPGQRHTQRASRVPMRVQLVPNGIPRSAISVPARVAGLHDEIGHHPMEGLPVEVTAPREGDEV